MHAGTLLIRQTKIKRDGELLIVILSLLLSSSLFCLFPCEGSTQLLPFHHRAFLSFLGKTMAQRRRMTSNMYFTRQRGSTHLRRARLQAVRCISCDPALSRVSSLHVLDYFCCVPYLLSPSASISRVVLILVLVCWTWKGSKGKFLLVGTSKGDALMYSLKVGLFLVTCVFLKKLVLFSLLSRIPSLELQSTSQKSKQKAGNVYHSTSSVTNALSHCASLVFSYCGKHASFDWHVLD